MNFETRIRSNLPLTAIEADKGWTGRCEKIDSSPCERSAAGKHRARMPIGITEARVYISYQEQNPDKSAESIFQILQTGSLRQFVRSKAQGCGVVDCFRLLFSYTGVHVSRTRKLEGRRGSVQGMPGKYSGAREEHAGAADRCKVSALP
jgi:hypothetical protein